MSRSTDRRSSVRPFAHRLVSALIAAILAVAGAVVAATPAYAAGGILSGKLVDQVNAVVEGVDIDIYDYVLGYVETVTSDSNGDFTSSTLDDSNDYYYWIHQYSTDINGLEVGLLQVDFAINSADLNLGNVTVRRAVPVSGTILNWSLAMGDVRVQVYEPGGGTWHYQTEGLSTGASFSVPALLDDGDYTLYFILDTPVTVPYLDAFLGGEFLEVDDAAKVTATAGTPLSGITMTMPDAAFISGRVTDSLGVGIPNITVSTEDRPDLFHYDETDTDSNGYYQLRAIPGLIYAVRADDYGFVYRSMVYQDLDPCGCAFTEVKPTYSDPATGIDFELTEEAAAVFIDGIVIDDSIYTGFPYDNVLIHLYKPVTGGWSEVDVTQSDSGYFELLLTAFGSYRMRFEIGGVWLPLIDGLAGEGTATSPDVLGPACYVDTGPLDASSVDGDEAFLLIAGLNPAGGCGPEPAPAGSSGGGQSSSGKGRTFGGGTLVAPTPTPTPSATPTSSPSPSSSPSSSPSPSETPAPAPAVDTGFPWWIILVIVLALGIIVTIIVIVRRR